jgi:hypothetical protein
MVKDLLQGECAREAKQGKERKYVTKSKGMYKHQL